MSHKNWCINLTVHNWPSSYRLRVVCSTGGHYYNNPSSEIYTSTPHGGVQFQQDQYFLQLIRSMIQQQIPQFLPQQYPPQQIMTYQY